MNIAIIYYSYSGNTDRVAKVIEELLSQDNSVRLLRIKALNESKNFFIQALRGLSKKKAEIAPVEKDLSLYDLIIFGTPVWAREMAPAMRKFLEKVTGLQGKKAVAFVTYGSGLGKEHCLDSLKIAIEKKGGSCIGHFSLNQFKAGDRVLFSFAKAIETPAFALLRQGFAEVSSKL